MQIITSRRSTKRIVTIELIEITNGEVKTNKSKIWQRKKGAKKS
jgi:hypothetical protein